MARMLEETNRKSLSPMLESKLYSTDAYPCPSPHLDFEASFFLLNGCREKSGSCLRASNLRTPQGIMAHLAPTVETSRVLGVVIISGCTQVERGWEL